MVERKKSRKPSQREDDLLADILGAATGDQAELRALLRALKRHIGLPCAGTLAGEAVTLTKFAYDGNARRGLTATVTRPGGHEYVVSAADVSLAESDGQRYLEAYRRWMGLAPAGDLQLDLAVLSLSVNAAWCRALGSGETVTLRPGNLSDLVPGVIATVKPAKRWLYGGHPYLSGSVEAIRLDAKALGLKPLGLEARGEWDPAEAYWGEPGEPIAEWAKAIIRRGRRPQFEMEQVVPGEDPDNPWSDPISESNDRKEAGDFLGAYLILMQLCRADLRCLDAHSHLGNLRFDQRPGEAIRHYEVGVRIGELTLGESFDGLLPWEMTNNRPFLRCLHGFGLCLWRLERFAESAAVFERLLWLSPRDALGARFVIDEIRAGRPWMRDV